MATLGTMKTRIANELARADLTSELAGAITSAIAHYERRRWWFLESESTFTTTPSTVASAPSSRRSDLLPARRSSAVL